MLVNRASPNPFLHKDLENLKEFVTEIKINKGLDNVVLLENSLFERQAYRKAVVEGKSIKEFCVENDKALQDFENFYQEILQLAKNKL